MENSNQQTQDLIIIGGGIMGLMTAYYASDYVKNITILEKRTIGKENKKAASFSFTRSIRSDYLDPLYTSLANTAQQLWKELEIKSDKKFYIDCGCLNIAKKSITPDLSKTYAKKSFLIREQLNIPTKKLARNDLQKKFPQFNADFGSLDPEGGFLYLPKITELMLKLLKEKQINIIENCIVTAIKEDKESITVNTNNKIFFSKKLIVTSGFWTNDVLRLVKGNFMQFPISADKPQENKYFYPPQSQLEMFLPENFPVFAYLDYGIYGHPIFDKKKGAIKIGYYNPPDVEKPNKKINSVSDFVNECLPIVKQFRSEDVNDADQCSYDMTKDGNFILGKLPNYESIFVGNGWNGTGYKFAPLVGKILSQLALRNEVIYDIKQFSPERFVK